jgi:hypothetical protein
MGPRADVPGRSDIPGVPGRPGISWEPGDEDYPFATLPGETALDYFQRWLDEAPYASVERAGARYVHEADVANVLNHITADVGLLNARLVQFGDQIVTAGDHASVNKSIDGAIALLRDVQAALAERGPRRSPG